MPDETPLDELIDRYFRDAQLEARLAARRKAEGDTGRDEPGREEFRTVWGVVIPDQE